MMKLRPPKSQKIFEGWDRNDLLPIVIGIIIMIIIAYIRYRFDVWYIHKIMQSK